MKLKSPFPLLPTSPPPLAAQPQHKNWFSTMNDVVGGEGEVEKGKRARTLYIPTVKGKNLLYFYA